MATKEKTPNYGLPQWAGNEYLRREDMNEAFAISDRELKRVESSAEDAVRQFDFLAQKYGYVYQKQENDSGTQFTETIKETCPLTATRVTTKSVNDGVKIYTTVVTIAGKSITLTQTKTLTGWEGVVS